MKTAVSVCEPTGNAVVERVAVPLATAAEPSDVLPYLNCTWPVADAGDKVAVKPTLVPTVAVAAGAATRVVVVAPGTGAVIETVATADVDVVNPAVSVGVNTAVSGCAPAVNVDVEAVALPAATGTAAPMFVAPSLNCTEPAVDVGVTAAVSAMLVPATADATEVVKFVVVVIATAPPPTETYEVPAALNWT